MPKVFKKGQPGIPADAVYIGRGSVWGNPYTHLRSKTLAAHTVDTREQAIACYIQQIDTPEQRAFIKRYLRGKNLVCFCAPLACHGNWLLKIANEDEQP